MQYGNSQILKATASFSYDRYICGESSSLARDLGRAFNDLRSAINPSKDGAVSYGDNDRLNNILRVSSTSGGTLNSDVASLRTSVTGNVSQVSTAGGTALGYGSYPIS